MIYLPNILLVAGEGQNVGKTTLVCDTINKFSHKYEIVAVKISSHIHLQSSDSKYLVKNEFYEIIEETNSIGNKDSNKMFRAGATLVLYVQVLKDSLNKVLDELLILINNRICIIESGGLRDYIEPGLFIYLTKTDSFKLNSNKQFANIILNDFNFSNLQLEIKENTWKVKV